MEGDSREGGGGAVLPNVVISLALLVLSGLFSGLNLGLMSLDSRGLEMRIRSGSTQEAKWAKAILPLRRQGNFLLCTLLLGNTAVNACLAIFVGSFAGGVIGGIVATIAIVIFGEIIPQSICSRHALAVGYYTRHIVYLFMVGLCPLAFPIAKILDGILGDDVAPVYSIAELRQLLFLNSKGVSDPERAELPIFLTRLVTQALRMPDLYVYQAMIPAEEMPCVSSSRPVDPQLVFQLFNCVHPCIPVIEEEVATSMKSASLRPIHRTSCKSIAGFVNVKDLILHGGMNAGITVRDIISLYDDQRKDGSNILRLSFDEEMSQAFEKFKKHHRYFAVVEEGLEVVGFVSARDLQRGWTHEHAREDDDGARFGFRTDALNNLVRSLAHHWRRRAKARRRKSSAASLSCAGSTASSLPGSPLESEGVIVDVDDMADSSDDDLVTPNVMTVTADPDGRDAIKEYLTKYRGRRFEKPHQAALHRRTLFVVYAHLMKYEAFRPNRLPPAKAVELLSLPRNYRVVPKDTELMPAGLVKSCMIIFRGQTKDGNNHSSQDVKDMWKLKDVSSSAEVRSRWTQPLRSHPGPLQVFHEEALSQAGVERSRALMAQTSCYVLYIDRDDYQYYLGSAYEAPRSPAVELHVCDLQHDLEEACETCHTNGTFSGHAFGTSSSREGGTEWSTDFSKCVELEPL